MMMVDIADDGVGSDGRDLGDDILYMTLMV